MAKMKKRVEVERERESGQKPEGGVAAFVLFVIQSASRFRYVPIYWSIHFYSTSPKFISI